MDLRTLLVNFYLTKDTEWVMVVEKKKDMAVDFEALDLVRSENKSRAYNKKLDELMQRNQSLQALAEEMVQEVPEHRRKYFLEKLKKSY